MANSAIHIREANLPGDKPVILDFIFALQRYEAAFEANRRTDAQMAQEHYAALIPRAKSPKGKIFIAENADGLAIGWALIHEELGDVFVRAEERAHGFLAELYVVEASRAQGVGRALIAACEDWARARGLVSLRIGLLARNSDALTVYEKAGYAPYALQMRKYL